MKKNSKRWLAILLATMMAVVFMPTMSFADEYDDGDDYSYEEAFGSIPEGDVEAINVDETKSVDTSTGIDGVVTFKFIAPADGLYAFYSMGDEDTKGGVIMPDGKFIDNDDYDWDEYEGNFRVFFEAIEGEEYYLQAKEYGDDESVMFTVKLEQNEIQKLVFTPANSEDTEIILGENMSGYWEAFDDGDIDTEYYIYDEDEIEFSFYSGDKLTVTDKDGNTKVYVFDDEDYVFKCGSDEIQVNDIRITSDQDDYDYRWLPGSYDEDTNPGNYYYLEYKEARCIAGHVTIKKGILDENKAKLSTKTSYTYTGKTINPPVTITYDGKKLVENTDYKLDRYSIRGIGRGYIDIYGDGEYAGSDYVSYTINPKGTKLGKLKGAKKSMTVKWSKMKSKMYVNANEKNMNVTGYQIMVATDKKFTKNKKTVTVKGYKKSSTKIKKLKKKKKYYVKVRTYVKDSDGETFYSSWSKVKKVKTK